MFQCKDCDVACKFILLLKGHFDQYHKLYLHHLNVEFVIKYTKLTDHKDAINKTGKITDKKYMFLIK